MLNELITWVLNTYLGKYLEDFNPAQLSVALMSGEVELENVPIRKDALGAFGIPVEALSGNIGKIKLQIPVRQFRTAPWCIVIESVYVVFGPKNLDNWNDEKEKLSEFAFKLAQLDSKEAKWRAEKGFQSEHFYSTSYSGWLNYGTTLATNILENLELKINDVHIRYEDSVTIKDIPFAAGFKIASLTVQSCDSKWVPGAKVQDSSISYKLVELKDFALYWDGMEERNRCSPLSSKDLLVNMNDRCNTNQHKYIILPISATAKCQRERCRQAMRSKLRPRLSCQVIIPAVKISVSNLQYKQIVDCIAGLHQIRKIRSHWMKRPKCAVGVKPSLWWQYAARCHGYTFPTVDEKWTIAKENLRYIRIYKRLLLNPNENLSGEDKEFKLHMEQIRSLNQLQILRNLCFTNVYIKDLNFKSRIINQGRSMLFHWFPNWWGWYGNADAVAQSPQQDETYKNIEDVILTALEDSIENDSYSRRDALFGCFNLILSDGQFLITTEQPNGGALTTILELEFENLTSLIEMKPRFSSYLVGVSVGSVSLKDRLTEGTAFPYLIKPQIDETQLKVHPPSTIISLKSKALTASVSAPSITTTPSPTLRTVGFKRLDSNDSNAATTGESKHEPWFQLQYQKGPMEVPTDVRLIIKSRSLDIVYNKTFFEWLVSFVTKPLQLLRLTLKPSKKESSRMRFLQNWKHLLMGSKEQRRSWSFEIDISAPRIFFVENYCEKNSRIVLVDFGRFQLVKREQRQKVNGDTTSDLDADSAIRTTYEDQLLVDNSEDDELFITPCSTPPGSEISRSESPTVCHDAISFSKYVINNDTGLESALHNKLYDKYAINLTDMQVLICRNQERGNAIFKNQSTFQLLDKFSISLELERRVIFTADPEYPSFTLFGALPRIVVHVNEQRLNEFFQIIYPITCDNIFQCKDDSASIVEYQDRYDSSVDLDQSGLNSNFVIVQFVVDQMILEVQSCEKSIAELQVIGARAGFTKRSEETQINMSVHGLLLVDAIQSFGPDFELLVASHRQVGMDSISGSLKQSEPCSPTSPGSPDPSQRPASPHIINSAMTNLETGFDRSRFEYDDVQALITVDVNLIEPINEDDSLQIANIAFNNLDIIANQETIVELLGFVNRTVHTAQNLFGSTTVTIDDDAQMKNEKENENPAEKVEIDAPNKRTEITFDFHRLNILVLRTLKVDGFMVGRKVGTLTMSESKIHATLGKELYVNGSLGGIQIVDITPEGVNHQRIFSVGKDPLTDPPDLNGHDLLTSLSKELFGYSPEGSSSRSEMNALSFSITRDKSSVISIKIRMASVWYTHCPRFIQEISLCVSQFKHYLKNFAKSIRDKATDMAKEFVQHINETTISLRAGKVDRQRSDTATISMDVILNSPVLVLPRCSQSSDVLVANLGKITFYNKHETTSTAATKPAKPKRAATNTVAMDDNESVNVFKREFYYVDVRNINLFSLNTSQRKDLRLSALPKANEFYSCKNDAVAILHDTALLFKFTKDTERIKTDTELILKHTAAIEGSVTQHLQVSLSRAQYDQVIESVNTATQLQFESSHLESTATDIDVMTSSQSDYANKESTITNLQFVVPVLMINLQNEDNNSLINITFRDFGIHQIRRDDGHDLQIQLKSILMEDLTCAIGSKFRNMVDSTAARQMNGSLLKNNNFSSSCPSLASCCAARSRKISQSMPNDLDLSPFALNATSAKTKGEDVPNQIHSASHENLVIYKAQALKVCSAEEAAFEDVVRSIDFNCLNLTIAVDKWFMVLEFFGLISTLNDQSQASSSTAVADKHSIFRSELKVSVRSLNLMLVRNAAELSKANISNAFFKITKGNVTEPIEAIEGRLGSLSLNDFTTFGHLYRERFSTTGSEALSFLYTRLNWEPRTMERRSLEKDATLHIQMSSVRYVHTKRFLMDFYMFIKELLQLQSPVLKRIQITDIKPSINTRPIQIGLEIHADSPIILLPLSYNSNHVIIADLGKLSITNSFRLASEADIISKRRDASLLNEILDVMHIDLVNINLITGERLRPQKPFKKPRNEYLNVGQFTILKLGHSFFKETCYLKLQVERNTDSGTSHNCPDISVKGTLSKLNCIVNLHQYKVIRGFLSYNLGETIDDVHANYSFSLGESMDKLDTEPITKQIRQSDDGADVWNTMSINLQLENVSILLAEQPTFPHEIMPIACVNFIKSSLEIDTFSDGSQDIDLISSEVLVLDSRQQSKNVFMHILKPTRENVPKGVVQAEIHSRKRFGTSKYTILLNNMRIMAILDCLGKMKDFFNEEPYKASAPPRRKRTFSATKRTTLSEDDSSALEVILNVTDSELVFIEKLAILDTNAIILKSSTVFSYKPTNLVPITVDINHLEIFSCVLGVEDVSALSIIDPFTLNMELRNNCFQVLIQKQLSIRLSYNDMKLFTKILHSIPKQKKAPPPKRRKPSMGSRDFDKISPLIAMGFREYDCWCAMELHSYRLNEAAVWLAQQAQIGSANAFLDVHNVVLNANGMSIFVIDDCMDADVPLLGISLTRLIIDQKLKHRSAHEALSEPFGWEGKLDTAIVADYYNRRLSGWEPVIESWECSANWTYYETNAIKSKTIKTTITSKQLLKLNITSTLMELCDIVRKNWTQDFYSSSSTSNPCESDGLSNFRRRSPFVPFALQNLTGEPLLFRTCSSQPGGITRTEVNHRDVLSDWIPVQSKQIMPFDFGPQTKLRHMDSHKLNLHQILVQIHGWTLIGPISVDKVGVYFKYALLDMQYKTRTRIVFDISLIGSAQKMITVRSALIIVNKLDKRLFLKMDAANQDDKMALSVIEPDERLSIPLRLVDSPIYFKPFFPSTVNNRLYEYVADGKTAYVDKNIFARNNSADADNVDFCTRGISWLDCSKDSVEEMYTCHGQSKAIFHTFIAIKRDKFPGRDTKAPGHTITLMPSLKLRNMLSCDLLYKLSGHIQGVIGPSEAAHIYEVNAQDSFHLSISLDNYKLSGQLKVPLGHAGIVELKLKLIDIHNRELYLRVSIQSFQGSGMEIYVSAPVWIINKTGLPLVYRQEGGCELASGQFEEHEKARVVSPLLFSFSDQESSPSLEIRLGYSFGEDNAWCKSFNIYKEITYRELKAETSKGCYAVGINARRGRGLYACTTFVTLSPRFQMYNKTTYTLQFAQKCDIIRSEIRADKIISAYPGCNFPFHWPNAEQEPLLCVRIVDVEFCKWSSGMPINKMQSLYINIRNDMGEMSFLRLEVLLRGATYMLLFSDAHILPPPIRIDNYSDVYVHFAQFGCKPHWRTAVRPQGSLAYALDDPMGPQSLEIEAPGGNIIEFSLNKLEVSRSITYANFIYIAFKETFSAVCSGSDDSDVDFDVESQELVLGVRDKRVVMTKKLSGDRSQLWLMNSNGQLEHEGSTSPAMGCVKTFEFEEKRMVLDLERAPNPLEFTALVIRPPNKQRSTTQTWRFENGRLMCHANLCVQARNGIYGLRPGSEAVLGRIETKSRIVNVDNIPYEQSIEIHKLRPGSGHLEVIGTMDGPIRTVQIRDVKETAEQDCALHPDPAWNHGSLNNKSIYEEGKSTALEEISIRFELPKGIGVSLISRKPCEELAYMTLDNIELDIISTPYVKSIDLIVTEWQTDNQLLDTPCPVLWHTTKVAADTPIGNTLVLRAKALRSPNANAVIFEYITFELRPCTVYLDERLILKMARFLCYRKLSSCKRGMEGIGHELNNVEDKSLSENSRRYYFENMNIGSIQIRLTVVTTTKLSPELIETKKLLGLTLINFEDAVIDFDKFIDRHHFETMDVYLKAMRQHYINQMKWHAAYILGSVDFLGNPLGFANDVSEGVSGLLFEGSVKSLVKNVTHGISNSTAKLTESLSDSLGRVVLDEHDNETRQKILEISSNTSGGHLAAGLKGLGFGLLSGVTSIVRHTYTGAQSEGFPGFLSGLGKGLVGTVTKPIIGVLDLASETASAVRETSKGPNRSLPNRRRLPRCVTGAPGGLLPMYSYRQSKGQQYLYIINRRHYNEKLLFYEPNLCNDRDAKLRLLVSSEFIRIFSRCDEEPAIMFECHLSEVLSCHPLTTNLESSTSTSKPTSSYYIEISTNLPKITRPRVRCQSEEIAERAARCINYAKSVYDDREQSVAVE